MSIPTTKQLNAHEKPPNHSQIYDTEGSVLPENRHLLCTSTKIKLWPLQLLTFNNPWKESRWTSRLRHSVIWNSHRAGQEIDNFWRRIYEPWFYILSYLEKHKFHWQLHFFWQWGKLKSRVKTGLPWCLSILKICLPIQKTPVSCLIWEDPTFCGAK